MIEEWVEDIEESLKRFFLVEEVLPLISKLFTGMNPVGMSIPMQFVGNMVGKMDSCELDMFEELKAVEKMNLFTIFPIGATMQDGGKRKRSDDGIYNTLGLLKKLNKEDKIYYINYINGILSIKSNEYKE